jgi:hypothetical protein
MQAVLSSFLGRTILLAVHFFAIYTKPLLVLRFLICTKRLPFFIVPRTLNEKYLWRKLFDHNPVFTIVSDKLACKDYIRQRLPDLGVAKVLKVLSCPDEILQLPDNFLLQPWVLKSSQGSGDVLVMPHGCLDRFMLVARATSMLAKEHGRAHHEWGYFNVPKKIFFEEYIQPQEELFELKFYTFGKHVGRVVQIGGRFKKLWAQAWELGANGQLVYSSEPATLASPKANEPLPSTTRRMLEIAKQLGKDFDHMRIDLLTDGQRIWFGELTVYNLGGYHIAPSGYMLNTGMTLLWKLKNAYCMTVEHKSLAKKYYFSVLKKQLLKKESAP